MLQSTISYIVFLVFFCEVELARILGVFPIPSKSHQVVFQSYTEELARRGHELVILAPTQFKTNETSKYITEIEVDFCQEALITILKKRSLKRGVIMDVEAIIGNDFYISFLENVIQQFKSTAVQKLFNDKNQKFDLIVVEGFYEYQLIVSEIFKAPVILFPSFMGFPEHYEMMGAVGRHPILYPHFHRRNYANLNFWGKIEELYYEVKLYNLFKNLEITQDKHLKNNFGPNAPTTKQLLDNVDMVFLNSYHIFSNNRPIPPNMVYLGATHLKPAKEIPKMETEVIGDLHMAVRSAFFASSQRDEDLTLPLLIQQNENYSGAAGWCDSIEVLYKEFNWKNNKTSVLGWYFGNEVLVRMAVTGKMIKLKDLKTYLDNSIRGVIYVSFGSNIRPSLMDKDLLNALLQAFEALPHDILWRYDGDSLENVPKNVKWQQWFPQRDLLFHPNIKAFVTQCGLQSTDEAIDSEVPLIGVPMMAEQWYNAQKYVDFGIGVKLESLTLTAEDLVRGVEKVVRDKSYKENIKRLRNIIHDQPQTPLEKAVWWTEYVIRHGGAKHLRTPSASISWTEYYMLDVILPSIGAFTSTLVIVFLALRIFFRLVLRILKKEKIKQS